VKTESRHIAAIAPIDNEGASAIALVEAVKCVCGRMAYFVVNRGGSTKCLDCDHKEEHK
jgi:hypothetical protein